MRRRKEEVQRHNEEWAAKSNVEKAREAIKSAEDFPFAPGQTAAYTAAVAYLLLDFAERGEAAQLEGTP